VTGREFRQIAGTGDELDARGTQTLTVHTRGGRSELRFIDARGRVTAARAPGLILASLSRDGRHAAVPRDRYVEIRDTPSLRVRTRLDSDGTLIDFVRFSPDARRLAGFETGTGILWDLASGRRATISGHTGFVESADFSVDGRLLLTAGDDATARVWDTAAGRQLVVLPGSGSAALFPGGRAVLTLGGLGPPLIRACDGCGTWDELVQRIDARARRVLTAAERRTYVR
jgi:WD40 repeat protein